LLLVAASLAGLVAAAAAIAAPAVAPTNTTPPTVTGTPTVGQTLTAGDGTWANTPTSYAYQWLRCSTAGASCVNVPNGTQKTYTLVGADAGHTMRVRVTATNADGSASAQSDQTAVVQPRSSTATPRNTAAPTITGTPQVGELLTAENGTWTNSPTSYTYAWQRCDVDIASCTTVIGATNKAYGVRTADLGYRIRVQVTAKNAAGSTTANSAITAVVMPAAKITNSRPSLKIISIRFAGSTVYARFRICDDSYKNVTILATDSRPGKLSYTRRFQTLTAPVPCGVYTRHWAPVARFRGHGKYTVTLKARDKSSFTSLAASRSFSR